MSAVPQTETELRVQLAACYRVFHLLGWTELIYNHITVRIPGPERHFLINPFGLRYDEVTASNLVLIDLDEGPRMLSRWHGPKGQVPQVGQRAQVTFPEVQGQRLPYFQAEEGAAP